jgi:hypothetical protein
MINVSNRKLCAHPLNAHRLKFEIGHGACRILRERLIDADADLAAGRHIAADEMCFDKLLTEGESHCMSSYLFEFLTIFFYCSRLLDFCQCFGQ